MTWWDYAGCCLEVTRDGRSLVALQDTNLSDVWVAKREGSDARQITTGEALGFGLSWVGNRLAAANSRGQWFLMSPDGSDRNPLTNDRDPHFQLTACSDGRHLVYSTWRNGRFELWASEVDGSNAVRLVPQAVMGFGAGACMPDSKSVVYVADNAVWRVSIIGGTPAKLDLPFAEPGYSPDGKLMFYVWHRLEGGAMQEKLVIAPADSKTPLHTLEYPYGMQFPQFTPDSKALAFLLSRNHATNIWELPLSGKAPTQLTKFPSGEMFAFEWSRDGKQLAFSRGQKKTDVIMMSNFR